MNQTQFINTCLKYTSLLGHQDSSYLAQQSWRLFSTRNICKKYLNKGARILSFGAGSAFVEAVLKQELDTSVTVVDFQEAIELNKSYYKSLGFTCFADDLSKEELTWEVEPFDLGISSEIVEHIPEAPSNHFKKLGKYVKKDGYLIVSTPNLGSIWHILRLLRMLPILAEGEKTFSPVSFENEGIHRREYMPAEIIDAMNAAGFAHVKTHFIWYHLPKRLNEWLLYIPQLLIPRFRPGLVIVGKKERENN
ncbi:MAG: class I SAM-dependent methyltransferase [Xenococcaceae cyanobacterium]